MNQKIYFILDENNKVIPSDLIELGDFLKSEKIIVKLVYSDKGWQCPKCEAVMSPHSPTCWYCKPKICYCTCHSQSLSLNMPCTCKCKFLGTLT